MKIAHLPGTQILPKNPSQSAMGGAVVATLDLAITQAAQGHEVYVLTTGQSKWGTKWQGVHLVSLPYQSWARWGRLDLRGHLPYMLWTLRYRPDVVHGHGYFYLRFLLSKRRIVHFHADPLPHKFTSEESLQFALTSADFAAIKQYSDCQIANSHFTARQLRQGSGTGGNIKVVYYGLDHDTYQPKTESSIRQQLELPADAVVFLYAGAIVARKGVIHLARAFCRLVTEHPNAHLLLAGSSDLWNHATYSVSDRYQKDVYDTLQTLIQSRQVHPLGSVGRHDMPDVYAAADIAVVPSVAPEPFGLVALEALAMGLPVIAFDTPSGLLDFLNDRNSVLVEAENESQLVEAMASLLENVKQRRAMGQAGIETAQSFQPEKTAQQIEQIYLGQ